MQFLFSIFRCCSISFSSCTFFYFASLSNWYTLQVAKKMTLPSGQFSNNVLKYSLSLNATLNATPFLDSVNSTSRLNSSSNSPCPWIIWTFLRYESLIKRFVCFGNVFSIFSYEYTFDWNLACTVSAILIV